MHEGMIADAALALVWMGVLLVVLDVMMPPRDWD
jgi:hypothetical protein